MEEKEERNYSLGLKSEEIQELIGQVPGKIVRWGTSVFFSAIVLILITCWFIPYHDYVSGKVIITTLNPPVDVIAKSASDIQSLKVKDGDVVKEGQLLGILNNSASHNDVTQLKMQLGEFSLSKSKHFQMIPNLKLGSITSAYSQFLVNLNNYWEVAESDLGERILKIKKDKIAKSQTLVEQYKNQEKLKLEELQLAEKQYRRDSILFSKKMISEAEFEKVKTARLRNKQSYHDSKITVSMKEIEVIRLQESFISEEGARKERLNHARSYLETSLEDLNQSISEWESKFVFTASTNGKVVFTDVWTENTFVNFGSKIMTIVPENSGEMVGEVILKQTNIGELHLKDRVNIKLDHFPYLDYGLVYGNVHSISSVPTQGFYVVKVKFPNGLVSSYNQNLTFTQGMSGNAEIITKEVSLLAHFFKPITALLNSFK